MYYVMPAKIANNEVLQFILKIIIPAMFGVGIKIAIEMKKDKTKVSFFNVCLSMFIGVAGAYISSGLVQKTFSYEYHSIVIAFIAIIADKIAEYVIYKLDIDTFLTAFFNGVFDTISNTFKRK